MDEIEERLIMAMPRIALRLQNELIIICPVDKGLLRLSIKVGVASNGQGLIIWMNETGKWVEFGTPPHTIKAKPGKFLVIPKAGGRLSKRKGKWRTKFKFGGKEHIDDVIFVKEVKHPGTRPNPFIRNTIQNKLANIIKEELLRE